MVAKKTPANKAKKTPTKKAPAKKASAKKTPDKKASAKKTPVARKAPAPAKKAAPPKKAPAAPKKVARRSGPGNPDADPVRIHEDYVRRHLGGGAPATPEAYEQAIEQFNRLPGAVRMPTNTPARLVPKPDDDGSEPAENEPEQPPS